MAKYEILIKAVAFQGLSYARVAALYGSRKPWSINFTTDGWTRATPHSSHARDAPQRHRTAPPMRSGRLLHIGRAHARTEIICLVHNNDATVITLATGELLSEFTLNPDKNYKNKNG